MLDKFQISMQKKGFTLLEMMVVITLLGLLFYATTLFENNKQTEREKADRLVSLLADTLQADNMNLFLWRMPARDGLTVDRISTTINKYTGLHKSYYNSGVVLYTGSLFAPFYDQDPQYQIYDIVWTGASVWNGSGNIITIEMTSDGISFSGWSITTPILEIVTGYASYRNTISIDRRVGKIEVMPTSTP